MSSAFYWLCIEHWKYGVREKQFRYEDGLEAMFKYLTDALDNGYEVRCLKVMNRGF